MILYNLYYLQFKRSFDIMFSAILLIILSPVLIVISLAIKIDSKGEIIFKQVRLGKNGKLFRLYKFRTMCKNAESMGSGIFTDAIDPRITRIGRFLRKTSLDELPQLFNILKGEMSIIGPRPVPPVHLDNYDQSDKRRLSVKPGITGWAQVNGRNTLTWPQKIEKDLYYIDHLSFSLDFRILLKTILVVFNSRGVYSGRYRALVQEKNSTDNSK